MAMVNPGVSFKETLLTSATRNDVVTTPLFIGFSATTAESVVRLQPVAVTSLTQAVALFGSSDTLAYGLRHFFDNGGLSCYALSLGQPASGDDISRLQALIEALQSADLQMVVEADRGTGLLLVPEMSELNDLSDSSDSVVAELWYQGWQALLDLCGSGQQRFALLELPDQPEKAIALSQRSFPTGASQNAAAWWPRLQSSYPAETSAAEAGSSVNVASSFRVLSPLPAVAAAIQKSATENGVWKAPANIALKNTLKPVRNILQSSSVLNDKGIHGNLIRSFAGKGVRLWGCRTLLNDDSSPWRYIQTRLLANSVETQLRKLARHYLFEPNNAQTWMKLRGQIWTWLRQQWLAGAFYGTTEEEAFTLSIGLNDTMSAEDIRAGKMIVQVQLALLAPAEFIDIQLTLDARLNTTTIESGS
ncbi:phage tail sheath C-terminal domain-containing protein [Erwinia persicina]|uniref:Phage tail sheath family protein n=1 Tax=Erwinia persicina TaxID=55211 RepID=A0A4U3EUR2_9GAMM|nr:phage tail sheath C-terminal domain-containing protein [Erwinia persicina]MBD8109112.1 phage tail sheath family protein [Erwinia persicina]MBD8170110.1 phage tail sheath family protein [Erwinia persicina]MBD8212236.1 phage tail sheath family protein [Erwinia persicina]TKJ83632.1 phage tail sheath family protein [Erwinia persicina]